MFIADKSLSKIAFLAESFNLVYSLKLLEFHLPHLQTSSLDISVGWLEIAAGMPARNEWPEIFSEFFPDVCA
jgi:hypothetical protein